MLHYIYTRPIAVIITTICLTILTWGILENCLTKKVWNNGNRTALCVTAGIILYTTLATRTAGNYEVVLTPFASFTAAHQQPELYREMLMNVFLFLPLGLTLSNSLPRKWHRWFRIGITTFIGCILSIGIEYTQFLHALGMAELDDVICNTLGAFIGSSSLLIARTIEKHKE